MKDGLMDWADVHSDLLRAKTQFVSMFSYTRALKKVSIVDLMCALDDLVTALDERPDIIQIYNPFFHHAVIDLIPGKPTLVRCSSLMVAATGRYTYDLTEYEFVNGSENAAHTQVNLNLDDCVALIEQISTKEIS